MKEDNGSNREKSSREDEDGVISSDTAYSNSIHTSGDDTDSTNEDDGTHREDSINNDGDRMISSDMMEARFYEPSLRRQRWLSSDKVLYTKKNLFPLRLH